MPCKVSHSNSTQGSRHHQESKWESAKGAPCPFSPVVGLEVDHGEGQRGPWTRHIHINGVTLLQRPSDYSSPSDEWHLKAHDSVLKCFIITRSN